MNDGVIETVIVPIFYQLLKFFLSIESEEIILYVQVLLSRINNSIPVLPVHWRIPRILLNALRLDSITQNSRGNETHINLKKAQDFSLKCSFTRKSRFYTITYSLKRTKCVTYSNLLVQFITRLFCTFFVYTT